MAVNFNFGEVLLQALKNQQEKEERELERREAKERFDADYRLREKSHGLQEKELEQRRIAEENAERRSQETLKLEKKRLLGEIRSRWKVIPKEYKIPSEYAGSVVLGSLIEKAENESDLFDSAGEGLSYMDANNYNAMKQEELARINQNYNIALEGIRAKNNAANIKLTAQLNEASNNNQPVRWTIYDSKGNPTKQGVATRGNMAWANDARYYGPGRYSVSVAPFESAPVVPQNVPQDDEYLFDNALKYSALRKREGPYFGYGEPQYTAGEKEFIGNYTTRLNKFMMKDPMMKKTLLDNIIMNAYNNY